MEFIYSNYGVSMFDDTNPEQQKPQHPEFDIEKLKNELPGWEEEWDKVLSYIYAPGGHFYTIDGRHTENYRKLRLICKKFIYLHSSCSYSDSSTEDTIYSLDELLGKLALILKEQGPKRILQSFDPACGDLLYYLVGPNRIRFLLRDTMRANRVRREQIVDMHGIESNDDDTAFVNTDVSRNEIIDQLERFDKKTSVTENAILQTLLFRINEYCLQAVERTLRGREMQQTALQLYPHYPEPPEAGQQKILEHLRNVVSSCHPNCSSHSYLCEIHEYEQQRIQTEKEAILKLLDTSRRGSRNSREYNRKIDALNTESLFYPISKKQLKSLLNLTDANADQSLSRYRRILKQFLSGFDNFGTEDQKEQEEM